MLLFLSALWGRAVAAPSAGLARCEPLAVLEAGEL